MIPLFSSWSSRILFTKFLEQESLLIETVFKIDHYIGLFHSRQTAIIVMEVVNTHRDDPDVSNIYENISNYYDIYIK